jgi:hypothetical protein
MGVSMSRLLEGGPDFVGVVASASLPLSLPAADAPSLPLSLVSSLVSSPRMGRPVFTGDSEPVVA